MKERWKLASNVSLFLLATVLLGAMQTSMWFEVFGSFPAPALWMAGLLYIAMYRSTLEIIISSYLFALVMSPLTVMPIGLLMMSCLALALATQIFKRRIYWSSASYIMMVSGLGVITFHFFHFIASQVFGNSPITRPQVIDWIIEALLTPLFAPALFPMFHWFDQITDRESSFEGGTGTTRPVI